MKIEEIIITNRWTISTIVKIIIKLFNPRFYLGTNTQKNYNSNSQKNNKSFPNLNNSYKKNNLILFLKIKVSNFYIEKFYKHKEPKWKSKLRKRCQNKHFITVDMNRMRIRSKLLHIKNKLKVWKNKLMYSRIKSWKRRI